MWSHVNQSIHQQIIQSINQSQLVSVPQFTTVQRAVRQTVMLVGHTVMVMSQTMMMVSQTVMAVSQTVMMKGQTVTKLHVPRLSSEWARKGCMRMMVVLVWQSHL